MYVLVGVFTKYFIIGTPSLPGMTYLFYSLCGSVLPVLLVILILWWPGRFVSKSEKRILGGLFPVEFAWIIPSGICTGFIVPTTTLMYTYGLSVMVAMVIMRSSLIIVGRIVDSILIWQGYSEKKIKWQENVAVAFGALAIVIIVFFAGKKDFQFLDSTPMMITMGVYIIPYSIRIYIMSRFKEEGIDNKAFFGIEQIFSAITIFVLITATIVAVKSGWSLKQAADFANGYDNINWLAIASGIPFGIVAFFSVFLFLYKLGSATFNVIINRGTSLIAGTCATLIFHFYFGGKMVKMHEWLALCSVFVAIGFLASAKKSKNRK